MTGFADGGSFLEAARTRIPDCILLDVHMPHRSGLEVLKQLNARQYGAPVVVMSAQADIPIAVDAIKSGAFDVIAKSLVLEVVVGRVREAIDA